MDVSYYAGDRFTSGTTDWVVLGEDRLCAGGQTVDEPVEVLGLAEVLRREGTLRYVSTPIVENLQQRGVFQGRGPKLVVGTHVYPAVMHPFLRDQFRGSACAVVRVEGLCATLRHPDGEVFAVSMTVLGEVQTRALPFTEIARQEELTPGMLVSKGGETMTVCSICTCRYRHCVTQMIADNTLHGFFASELRRVGSSTLLVIGTGLAYGTVPPVTIRPCLLPPCFF